MIGPNKAKRPKFMKVSLVVSVGLIDLALSIVPTIQANGIKATETTVNKV